MASNPSSRSSRETGQARIAAWRTMRGTAPGSAVPTWMILAHPLLIAMTACFENSRNLRCEEDLTMGEVSVKTMGVRLGLHAGVMETRLEIDTAIPETILAGLAGRRLSQLLALPTTRREDVDRAVADIIVAGHVERDGPPMLRLAPTRWLPMARHPDGRITAEWLRHEFRA